MGDAERPGVDGEGKLERSNLKYFKAAEDDLQQVELPGDAALEGATGAGFQDQLSEQRGNIHHAALTAQRSHDPRFEIEGSHGHAA